MTALMKLNALQRGQRDTHLVAPSTPSSHRDQWQDHYSHTAMDDPEGLLPASKVMRVHRDMHPLATD